MSHIRGKGTLTVLLHPIHGILVITSNIFIVTCRVYVIISNVPVIIRNFVIESRSLIARELVFLHQKCKGPDYLRDVLHLNLPNLSHDRIQGFHFHHSKLKILIEFQFVRNGYLDRQQETRCPNVAMRLQT